MQTSSPALLSTQARSLGSRKLTSHFLAQLRTSFGGEDAKQLIANGVTLCAEVSNMGCTPEAIDAFIAAKVPYAPARQLTQVV